MSFATFNLLTLKIKQYGGPLRKVSIPDFYTFRHLHRLMLFLFEWDGCHLHRFEIPQEAEEPDMDPSNPLYSLIMSANRSGSNFLWVSDPNSFLQTGDQEEKDESTVALSFAFSTVGDKVKYEYDFGDSWRVDIILDKKEAKRVKKSEYVPQIQVVGGRGKTIPEYGEDGGTKYNRKKLNEDLAKKDSFTYIPWDVEPEEDELDNNHNNRSAEESDAADDAEEVEAESLEQLRNCNRQKKSILGKRGRSSDDDHSNANKKQKT